jgi:cbb3-type cytochrome oxidase maturation protein
LLVAISFLGLFIWSIRAGQYDDEYTPSVRILFDDEKNVLEDENSKFQIPNSKQNKKTKKNKFKTKRPLTTNQ